MEPLLRLSNGKINGLESMKKLKKLGMIKPSGLCNAWIITPMCERSFNFCLVIHPIGKGFTHTDFQRFYQILIELANDNDMKVLGLAGDGDNRMRAFQRRMYVDFPLGYAWLQEEEFGLWFGLGKDFGDIGIQDLLHVLKKLRNNLKYLSSKLLLFCDPDKCTFKERLKYIARWDAVIWMWENCEEFRDAVCTNCITVKDKQDPTAVTEMCFCYDLFYEAGFHGTGLVLELIYLLLSAFYDKSLKPEDRVCYVMVVRTVLISSKEALTKLRIRVHCWLTPESFTDTIIACDALIWYMVLAATKYPDQQITPWWLTSDPCEQKFGRLRRWRYKGLRTNLSTLDIAQGMSNDNRSLELDARGFHLVKETIAHSRGKSTIPVPEPTEIYYGRDTNIHRLRTAMREGVTIGQERLRDHTNFAKIIVAPEEVDDEFVISANEIINSDAESSDEEEEEDKVIIQVAGDNQYLADNNQVYSIEFAKAKYLNDGRSRMPGQTRFMRIEGKTVGKMLMVDRPCPSVDPHSPCQRITIGDLGCFYVKVTVGKVKRTIIQKGKVWFLNVSSKSNETSRSAVSDDPLNSLCISHTLNYHVWLQYNNIFYHSKDCKTVVPSMATA